MCTDTCDNSQLKLAAIPTGVSAIAIASAAVGYHTCTIVTGGDVKCWGGNIYGQLGIRSTADQNIPMNVGLLVIVHTDLTTTSSRASTSALTTSAAALMQGSSSSQLRVPAVHRKETSRYR
jgi:alpha-tubulin suppressor-like RCC1 family protein